MFHPQLTHPAARGFEYGMFRFSKLESATRLQGKPRFARNKLNQTLGPRECLQWKQSACCQDWSQETKPCFEGKNLGHLVHSQWRGPSLGLTAWQHVCLLAPEYGVGDGGRPKYCNNEKGPRICLVFNQFFSLQQAWNWPGG